MLELYFKQKLQESHDFKMIGSWWEPKDNSNEIDIVAISLDDKHAYIAEVKRQRKNFKQLLFEGKIEYLKTKVLNKYSIRAECLTLEDM